MLHVCNSHQNAYDASLRSLKMKITLIRHGEPECELTGKVQSREIPGLINRYNTSGIVDSPPEETKQKAQQHNITVCSDLFRSIESAEKLGIEKIYLTDPLFREFALPHFKTGSLNMSISAWITLYRVLSLFGFSKNGESIATARKRANLAASRLIEIAKSHESVLLVGHGFTNYFIARELLSQNWQGPKSPGKQFWEFGEYIYAGA